MPKSTPLVALKYLDKAIDELNKLDYAGRYSDVETLHNFQQDLAVKCGYILGWTADGSPNLVKA